MNKRERGILRIVVAVTVRFIVVSPLVAIDAILYISVIGIPLAIPLGMVLGKFMAKPLMTHEYFDPKAQEKQLKRIEAEDAAKLAADPNWFVNRKNWSN